MAVNPAHAQVYLFGTAAAWQLGAVAQAHDRLITLRGHKAFSSLAAVRVTLAPTYDPAALGQCELLIDSLREAGLPEG